MIRAIVIAGLILAALLILVLLGVPVPEFGLGAWTALGRLGW